MHLNPDSPLALADRAPWTPGRALRRLWFACLLGLLLPAAAGAAGVPKADQRAVREVVQAQLDAFAADDAERAFGYASAAIRAQFGNAGAFMAMVRGGYPMVVRPASVAFFQPRPVDGAPGAVSQQVQLRDSDGRLWMATYLLERQPNKGWRIGGCVVVADSGKAST